MFRSNYSPFAYYEPTPGPFVLSPSDPMLVFPTTQRRQPQRPRPVSAYYPSPAMLGGRHTLDYDDYSRPQELDDPFYYPGPRRSQYAEYPQFLSPQQVPQYQRYRRGRSAQPARTPVDEDMYEAAAAQLKAHQQQKQLEQQQQRQPRVVSIPVRDASAEATDTPTPMEPEFRKQTPTDTNNNSAPTAPSPQITTTPDPAHDDAARRIQNAYRNHRQRQQVASRLSELSSISIDLDKLNFLLRSRALSASLEFVDAAESARLAPGARANRPYVEFEEGLTKLLLRLDGVQSGGDARVREERKRVIGLVQKELDGLERYKEEVWAKLTPGDVEDMDVVVGDGKVEEETKKDIEEDSEDTKKDIDVDSDDEWEKVSHNGDGDVELKEE